MLHGQPFSLVYGDTGPPPICDLRHPQYVLNQENWEKWRLTYLGGSRFLKRYLKKFTRREDDNDFADRAAMSYVPAFAKAAINDVKNSIFQRIADVTRDGGPASYHSAMSGADSGVDMLGSAMNTFIGRDILPELLTMARVGIYVDMPELHGPTKADKGNKRPYLYWYRAEDIRSWAMNDDPGYDDPTEFKAILLRDSTYDVDEHWVLPYETTTRYRYMWIGDDGYVHCRFYKQDGTSYLPDNEDEIEGEIILPIKRIPFVLLELSDSLLADVADYQIALMNLASSDMSYALKANYPFYVEQYDPRSESPHLRPSNATSTVETSFNPTTLQIVATQEKVGEIRTGPTNGRRYPLGTNQPGFINPSPEPLRVSMEKQEQLKAEIRQLINLAISALSPTMASAESKEQDTQGLEAGLSYIGLELEHAERKIAQFWAMYEGGDVATVRYPENYSLLDDADRRDQCDSLKALLPHVPSLTYQREIAKQIVKITLGSKVSSATLAKILSEIDKSPVVLGDPVVIEKDLQNGLVSLETASKARGYPEGEVGKAKTDHEERLKRIAISQAEGGGMAATGAQARGVSDLGADEQAGKKEKAASRETTTDDVVTDKTRGNGK